jgi:hypothetical protein
MEKFETLLMLDEVAARFRVSRHPAPEIQFGLGAKDG